MNSNAGDSIVAANQSRRRIALALGLVWGVTLCGLVARATAQYPAQPSRRANASEPSEKKRLELPPPDFGDASKAQKASAARERNAGLRPSQRVEVPQCQGLEFANERAKVPPPKWMADTPPDLQKELMRLPPVCLTEPPSEDAPEELPPPDEVLQAAEARRPSYRFETIPGVPNPHRKEQKLAGPKGDASTRLASYDLPPPLDDSTEKIKSDTADPHAEVFAKSCFPSAADCKKCHEQIYEEWAISSHANAAISPMFHRFEQKINQLTRGTIGTFCVRCHAPVATTESYPRHESLLEGPRVYREGVTCVACHRVAEEYGKVNGERRLEPGPLEAPVYGSSNGEGVEHVLRNADHFKVKTDPDDKSPGILMHRRAIQFKQLNQSSFCVSCHQVAVVPGIKLEVVWDQYRASPAFRQGIRCQDCHMGKVPGMNEGFSIGPVAIINGKASGPDRKHSNHVFYGPGYSIAHPGLYPPSVENDKFTARDWLKFDWRAGWGTKEFEDGIGRQLSADDFPPEWREADDRADAREILNKNFERLRYKRDLRRQVMENGSRLDGPFFDPASLQADGKTIKACSPLHFCIVATNTNNGHNMPSGSLGAQPQIWINVRLIGPDGKGLWESGYLDSRGDLCDIHSIDVRHHKAPFDEQLFNLQTKFLTTNVKGTDREMYLPVNFDFDQLPFIRPGATPNTVINHPPFIRMEAHSLPPLGHKKARYHVPGNLLEQPGTYRIAVRMRMRAEPIYFMLFCESTPDMIRSMNEQILDFHEHTVAFEVR